jgi:hypothetical protein
MNIDSDVTKRLQALFQPLHQQAAKGSMPPIGFLSERLSTALDGVGSNVTTIVIKKEVAVAFATAAVDIWLRAVHSFLISCALTEASPIWASTTGYYASHYSVRALAHVLGYFLLFRKTLIVTLDVTGGKYSCHVQSKGAKGREHRFYWRAVKQHPQFASDPFFTQNEPNRTRNKSRADKTDVGNDVGHRDRANYADHVGTLPIFQVIELERLKQRVVKISKMPFDAPPIPRPALFPDVASVQIVAYHRIVRFRQLLDEAIGARNRFWSVHRNPSWAKDVIDFQLTEWGGLQGVTN